MYFIFCFVSGSHGRLYSYPLTGPCSDPVPGMLISVFTSISTNNPVAMITLNETTIAAYGADANEEGAVLLIYNIQFKLVQAIQKLKLYTKDAKLWHVDDKLLLAANKSLALIPYRLASQRIETMLGSSLRFKNSEKHKDEDNDIVEIQETTIASWQKSIPPPCKISTKGVPKNIAKQINVFVNEGASDATIQESLIPQLIETKDVRTIVWCFDNFKDLPEKLLVNLLSFCLKTNEQTFKPLQNGNANNIKHSDIISRNCFLDRIFSCSFSDLSVLGYLKSTLNFNQVLRLINYLIDKLNSEINDECLIQPNDKQLYEWANLLLDSHYQHYLLSQDPQVLVVLNKLKSILDDHVSYLFIIFFNYLLRNIHEDKKLFNYFFFFIFSFKF